MKKVLLSVVIIALLTSCYWSGIRYSSTQEHAEEHRQLKGFERIELLGSIDVKYAQADSFSVSVQAPADVLKDVETRVVGNVLQINMKGSDKFLNIGVSDGDDVTVYVTSPDFLGIELKGSGDFECNSLLDTDNLDILLKGSGDINFKDIICDHVNVSLVGSGDIEVKNVKTLRSNVELVGSGDVEIHFTESGVVESSLVGSGDIKLSGTVNNSISTKRGSGDLDTNRLIVR